MGSTDTYAGTVLPGQPVSRGDLVLAVDEAGILYEVGVDQPGEDALHCLCDWDALIERIASSASILVEHAGASDPLLLGPRSPDCADDPWLTRVVGCLMRILPDLPSRCQLVSAALRRLAGAAVTVARRPVSQARQGGGGGHGGHRCQFGGRWFREFPVYAVAAGPGPAASWSLVVPDEFPDDEALSLAGHPLLARLAGLPGPGQQARSQPPVPRPVLGLVRAVVAADAAAFAATAAALAHAAVTVVGSDGTVIASSAGAETARPGGAWEPAGEAREILLRDEAGLHGAVRVEPGRPGSSPVVPGDLGRLLGDLGLALIRSIQSGQRQRSLENQLVMLTCLSGRDAERGFWPDGAPDSRTPRRLVIVGSTGRIAGHAAARLLDAVVRAAAERAGVLSGLCMVTSQGWLVGLYPDHDEPLARHRRAWTQVLHSVGANGRLTAAVGAAVSDIGDFSQQNHLLGEIAKIQQSGSRYFNLPQVAMLDELGPLAEVIGATPGRGFAPFVERVLGDLPDDTRFGGQLIETLYAYLQTGGSPGEAGALLHLHPSTVKYRIRVIRELLGPRLADQGSRLDIELAVRLCLAASVPRTGRPGRQVAG